MAKPLNIVIDIDDGIPESEMSRIPKDQIDRADIGEIIGIPGGMTSGRASVAITARLPNGRGVMLETSMRNLLLAAVVLGRRYGSELGDVEIEAVEPPDPNAS